MISCLSKVPSIQQVSTETDLLHLIHSSYPSHPSHPPRLLTLNSRIPSAMLNPGEQRQVERILERVQDMLDEPRPRQPKSQLRTIKADLKRLLKGDPEGVSAGITGTDRGRDGMVGGEEAEVEAGERVTEDEGAGELQAVEGARVGHRTRAEEANMCDQGQQWGRKSRSHSRRTGISGSLVPTWHAERVAVAAPSSGVTACGMLRPTLPRVPGSRRQPRRTTNARERPAFPRCARRSSSSSSQGRFEAHTRVTREERHMTRVEASLGVTRMTPRWFEDMG